MKRYKIVDPVFDKDRKLIGSEETILTDFDIIDDYFPYWSKRMKAVGKEDMISIERCIDDYIVVNWAEELK